MTKLLYLTDSYKKTHTTKVVEVKTKGQQTFVVLDETIFYPQGGGQPSDQGTIVGPNGKLSVTHVRMREGQAIHEGILRGTIASNDEVQLEIDWELRLDHMRWHSAGHILHEIVMQTVPGLHPVKGEHGAHPYIEYAGSINPKLTDTLEKQTNILIAEDRLITSEFVTLDELKKRAAYVPAKLPENKPLRIVEIQGFTPIPDGGTQVRSTAEVGPIKVTEIESLGETTRVHYAVPERDTESFETTVPIAPTQTTLVSLSIDQFRSLLLEMQETLLSEISETKPEELEALKVRIFGSHGEATTLIKKMREIAKDSKRDAGLLVNEFKTSIEQALEDRISETLETTTSTWFDTSLPGKRPPLGHLHIVTQAISEITDIFKRIGFTRVRHPEVDWDYYPFESLNMPANHPARDEWETFFIEYPGKPPQGILKQVQDDKRKKGKIVLTPHTSNGQVREMEKGHFPIRMINIAKCYRRQSDVSHVPMFHQFEGLYIDENVSIGHLKGVFDYFVKQFFGPTRKSRLRPFHFQFTEPSFEIDISCGVCNGAGCRLCKEGWLELGGSGMVHPVVLRNGGAPENMTGFAFGWGVERTYMMKAGTQLDDIRLLYSNDIRFLEQF